MSSNTIAIIGGGVAGLAAGIYLQRNGYTTTIFEKCGNGGGVSVSWKRRGYTFDGATNWLAGSGPGSSMHGLLREVLDFSNLSFVDSKEFIVIEHNGEQLRVFANADELEGEMLRIAPEDRAVIKTFCNAIRAAGSYHIPFDKPPELLSLVALALFPIANLPFIRFFLKWKKVSLKSFASRFSSPKLHDLFLRIFPHHEHFSVFSLIMTLGWMHVRSGGYPMGGSETIVSQMEHAYRTLGGTIRFNSPVTQITTEDGVATGVMVHNEHFAADRVVSTADEVHTLDTMLDKRCTTPAMRSYRESREVYPALLQISLGLRRVFPGEPHKMNIDFITPCEMGSFTAPDMMVRICNFDPSLAPEGCTSVIVHIRTPDWQYWNDLRSSDFVKYRVEKERVAAAVIATLDARFGRISETLDVVDIATPATWIHYNNIFKASYQGWAPTPKMVGVTLPKRIKGLQKFYMSGQWQWPAGGLPGVIRLGRHIAQIICAEDRIPFTK